MRSPRIICPTLSHGRDRSALVGQMKFNSSYAYGNCVLNENILFKYNGIESPFLNIVGEAENMPPASLYANRCVQITRTAQMSL
jgi:hypothetical protein